ncbi:uncharacterized protein TNCT_519411 [Trichonephila clavata]|uniref:Uncharacterized protein n=1 Tax=Trichonephila clavata TaxID=2740835 RepID=A0A8X6KRW4_TRICU|nr:uncharacterized protein TNCT_519411 [Trichonephila clavata]
MFTVDTVSRIIYTKSSPSHSGTIHLRELGNILNKRATQQATVVTAKTTTAKDENSKEVHEQVSICESSEEAQNDSTTVEPTSVNRETNKQEPNSLESPSSAEPYFDATDEKDKPLTQQRQAILAGVVGAVLLVSCVALYIMKMPVVAVVVGIVGLVCIGFALYNIINPNTKLEKVKSVEQPVIQFPLNPTYAQKTSSKFQIS